MQVYKCLSSMGKSSDLEAAKAKLDCELLDITSVSCVISICRFCIYIFQHCFCEINYSLFFSLGLFYHFFAPGSVIILGVLNLLLLGLWNHSGIVVCDLPSKRVNEVQSPTKTGLIFQTVQLWRRPRLINIGY